MRQLQERAYALYEKALKSPTLLNTVWLGGGSAVNALVGALTYALYARLLGVDDFGVLTLLISLTTMLTGLADLGVGGALIRFIPEKLSKGDRDGLDNVLAYALKAKTALVVTIIAVSVVLAAPLVGVVFGHLSGRAVDLFLVMLIAVTANAALDFFRYLYYGHREFRKHSLVAVVPAASKLLLAITIALIAGSVDLGTIVLIEIVSAVAGFIAAYLFSPYRGFRWHAVDTELRKEMFNFGKWWALHGVLTVLAARVDVFFLGGLGNARALGLYGAAVKIAAVLTMMSQSFLTALLPEVSADPAPEAVERKKRKAWLLVGLFVAGLGVVMVLSPVVIRVLFGREFEESAGLLRMMCAGVMLVVLSYPFQASLFAASKSAAFSVGSGLSLATMAAGSLLLIPTMGAWGASIAYVASSAVVLLVYAFFVGRQTGPPTVSPPDAAS